MCTLIALFGTVSDAPLVVAANRDEAYARPALAPRRLPGAPRAVGGIDVEKGGTWLGVTDEGVFVGLTNQRPDGPVDPRAPSRGNVVVEALARGSVASIDAFLETLDPRVYNPFNLLYGDARGLRVAYARRDRARLELASLPPGVHVLANDAIGSLDFPRARRAEELVQPLAGLPYAELEGRLRAVLADHEKPDPAEVLVRTDSPFPREVLRELGALCIHTPVYGTRSSAVLALDQGTVRAYLHADGSPCTTPFTDVLRATPE